MELEIAGKTNQKDHFDIKKRANTASLHHQTQPMKKTPLLVLLFRHDHNTKVSTFRSIATGLWLRKQANAEGKLTNCWQTQAPVNILT